MFYGLHFLPRSKDRGFVPTDPLIGYFHYQPDRFGEKGFRRIVDFSRSTYALCAYKYTCITCTCIFQKITFILYVQTTQQLLRNINLIDWSRSVREREREGKTDDEAQLTVNYRHDQLRARWLQIDFRSHLSTHVANSSCHIVFPFVIISLHTLVCLYAICETGVSKDFRRVRRQMITHRATN